MIVLSERLKKVTTYIPIESVIADIGSDHAYLPCYAVQNGLIKSAIAGEVNQGPFDSALSQVKALRLENQIEVRLGDGLEVVSPNEVNVVVIAGMGGQLISNILNRGKARLEEVHRLILQPNMGAKFIREWLEANGWALITESILEEDEKIYEILVAERTETTNPLSDAERLLGPFLMREKNETFIKKWEREQMNWKRIVNQLEQANPSEEIIDRKRDVLKKIQIVSEALK
ncbi:tRNA (adenine(22)-N(1))-methyltransferase [Pseudalkalibacillus berkeleyi]|uniref:tRNA (Adenine(22)-N(1))-methyltransferase TrmK n=1 Tax=Pseudalkalibacillus berkeleyi TaxID=1069813 RepID=A0ABS9H2C8_9BACL|nr:tRNA (adenine(22)-N(1))-methyltransferase TrmK [Pseudalkalibacillus berkeleyi]MCF6137948.1 tRNA (adenine(22)-N(1))-methyltransferase TrmK [Pseudalkalibacillus berkeleyi]